MRLPDARWLKTLGALGALALLFVGFGSIGAMQSAGAATTKAANERQRDPAKGVQQTKSSDRKAKSTTKAKAGKTAGKKTSAARRTENPSGALSAAQESASARAASQDKEADLKQIRSRIDSIRERIESETVKRDALAGELKSADEGIRSARERGDDIRKQRRLAEQRLAQLRNEVRATEDQIADQRNELASQLRVAYMNGRQEQLKLVLNQQDPAELGRMMAYYGYFGRARAERIAVIEERLGHLQALNEDAEKESARLRGIDQDQQRQVQDLARARERRAVALASVQSELKSKHEEMGALQRQAAALEKLIAELRAAVDEFPQFTGQPFDKLQGQLPWPVQGKVVGRFGELRSGGPLRWEGLLIETSSGAQVHAPMAGRVVYADWLNGLDYLVVLDHGNGYMSLYGHHEQLYRRVGDRVAPGDLLGDLAERPGGRSELYMEIRKSKQPLDPAKWLRRK